MKQEDINVDIVARTPDRGASNDGEEIPKSRKEDFPKKEYVHYDPEVLK